MTTTLSHLDVPHSEAQPAGAKPAASGRIASLDGLRGIAALMVLFHHTLLMLPDFANAEWQVSGAQVHGPIEWLLIRTPLRLMWSGQARALLFFVLSGFVLALPWLNGRARPYRRFIVGRICRIYPPYLVAMIIAAAGSILLGGHALSHATIFFNQLGWAFHPSWNAIPSVAAVLDAPSSGYMNEGMWTLVWEFRIAFVFPLLMIPVVRWGNGGILGVLAILYVFHRLATGWFGASPSVTSPQEAFYYAQFFVLGAAVAANRHHLAALFARYGHGIGPACLALGCMVCWFPWPVEDDRMIALGSAIILAAIVGDAKIQPWFAKPVLLWLGQQSYSLYLIHLPLIMTVIIVFHGSVPVAACLAVIPAAIALSALFRRWVELPSVALTQHLVGIRGRSAKRAEIVLPAAEPPLALPSSTDLAAAATAVLTAAPAVDA